MTNNEIIARIFERLSKDTQRYLINMAVMAKVAEESALKSKNEPTTENPPQQSA